MECDFRFSWKDIAVSGRGQGRKAFPLLNTTLLMTLSKLSLKEEKDGTEAFELWGRLWISAIAPEWHRVASCFFILDPGSRPGMTPTIETLNNEKPHRKWGFS